MYLEPPPTHGSSILLTRGVALEHFIVGDGSCMSIFIDAYRVIQIRGLCVVMKNFGFCTLPSTICDAYGIAQDQSLGLPMVDIEQGALLSKFFLLGWVLPPPNWTRGSTFQKNFY